MSRLLDLVAIAPGIVLPTASDHQADPSGWLFCDGRAISRATYAALFAAIGTKFGAGDGSTTFNIPDMRGRSPIGSGQGTGMTDRALGASGGEENHELVEAETPPHSHGSGGLSASSGGSHSHGLSGTQSSGAGTGPSVQYTDANESGGQLSTNSGGAHTHSISGTTASAGGGAPHNNMQPFAVLNFLIKT